MDNKKKLIFSIDADDHARLRIKLHHERMTQSMFFDTIVKGFLEDNYLLKQFFDLHSEKRLDAISYKKRIKDAKEFKETINDYALNKEEISNIFDILERELDENE